MRALCITGLCACLLIGLRGTAPRASAAAIDMVPIVSAGAVVSERAAVIDGQPYLPSEVVTRIGERPVQYDEAGGRVPIGANPPGAVKPVLLRPA